MKSEEFKFGDKPNNYLILVNEDGVVVYGCDCCESMEDEVVVKVYVKLEEYIKFKGLSSHALR